MKMIGVIPARYASSRIPGKPLADICGRPMVWWVYQESLKLRALDGLYVATDNEEVMRVCRDYGMNAIMTSESHEKHLNRIHEVSEMVPADYYVVICGDEPLVEARAVEQVFPTAEDHGREFVVRSLMRNFDDPVEATDTASMKAAVNAKDECIFLTRSIVPFPYKTIDYQLKRLVGIECFNKKALDFFASQPTGVLEKIEDITLLRFLEHHIVIQLVMTDARQIGVDTPKNLESVRKIIGDKLMAKEIELQ